MGQLAIQKYVLGNFKSEMAAPTKDKLPKFLDFKSEIRTPKQYLHFEMVDGCVTVWVVIDVNERPNEHRFCIFPTGYLFNNAIPQDKLMFIGTYSDYEDPKKLVYHLFEVKK